MASNANEDGYKQQSLPDPFIPGRAIWPGDKHRKRLFFQGGSVKNIVIVLMIVYYNSLRIYLIYLTLLPPEECRFIWVPKAK